MTTAIDATCLHCDAQVTAQEITDGWCDSCGKKLPLSYKQLLKGQAAAPAPTIDCYDEPSPGSRGVIWVAAAFLVLAMSAVAAAALLNAG